MPYELLEHLSHAELPFLVHGTYDIDKVLILDAAGLVEAEIPPSMLVKGVPHYTGSAKILKLTPAGLAALERRRG